MAELEKTKPRLVRVLLQLRQEVAKILTKAMEKEDGENISKMKLNWSQSLFWYEDGSEGKKNPRKNKKKGWRRKKKIQEGYVWFRCFLHN
jgi:hypothetical protein